MSSKPVDFQHAIEAIKLDVLTANTEGFRQELPKLFNLFEGMAAEIMALRLENQKLRDENNRLKGEQGKPNIRPQTKNKDISSEVERRKIHNKLKKVRKSKAKKHKIKIDHQKRLSINKRNLPADAVFKGWESVVVQDLRINIEFLKATYYSPSERKTYRAALPLGYEGEFGPVVHSMVISLASDNSGMTQPAIVSFLQTHGIFISAATVARILSDGLDPLFHQEKNDIMQAGKAASPFMHIDDTTARVNGKNNYTHVLCNPYFSAYVTLPRKDRMSIIEVLSQGAELLFKFGEKAFELMALMGLPKKYLEELQKSQTHLILSRRELNCLLDQMFPNPKQGLKSRETILEACAICAYQDSPEAVSILICDDAPQFKLIASLLGLCWIHEGRHYKKLTPFLPASQALIDQFLSDFWDFYEKLLAYKEASSSIAADALSQEFDALFQRTTGYEQLDKRIAITFAKKEELLLVLKHAEIPLHNNSAELGARAKARSRDVSFQTRSPEGTQAKDTLMTLAQTARKLGVNFFDYIYDRVARRYLMPSLASLIPTSRLCPNSS
ncbi:MAG: transposase [Myxococcaceae bacterium]